MFGGTSWYSIKQNAKSKIMEKSESKDSSRYVFAITALLIFETSEQNSSDVMHWKDAFIDEYKASKPVLYSPETNDFQPG